MTMHTSLSNLRARFNGMTLRERALLSIALLAILVVAWDRLFMTPLHAKRQRLEAQIGEVRTALVQISDAIEGRAQDNPIAVAIERKKELNMSLAAIDAQLHSESSGLIAPQDMLVALRDVLAQQKDLHLVSMRNLPVASLVASANEKDAAPSGGPYVHSLEMVIDGRYLDVLQYLKSVEALKWHFYWQVLELKSRDYPLNRVRIRLSTLSMDKEWLGV